MLLKLLWQHAACALRTVKLRPRLTPGCRNLAVCPLKLCSMQW